MTTDRPSDCTCLGKPTWCSACLSAGYDTPPTPLSTTDPTHPITGQPMARCSRCGHQSGLAGIDGGLCLGCSMAADPCADLASEVATLRAALLHLIAVVEADDAVLKADVSSQHRCDAAWDAAMNDARVFLASVSSEGSGE